MLTIIPTPTNPTSITDPIDATARAAVLRDVPRMDAFGVVTRAVQGQIDANTTHELLYLMLNELSAIRAAVEK